MEVSMLIQKFGVTVALRKIGGKVFSPVFLNPQLSSLSSRSTVGAGFFFDLGSLLVVLHKGSSAIFLARAVKNDC
jgi:hypothetical protein